MKRLLSIVTTLMMSVVLLAMPVPAQESTESTLIDLKEYLWEIPEGASADEMMLLLNRNNTIIEDMESLFAPDSMPS